MLIRPLLISALAITFAGCAAPVKSVMPTDTPANPAAAETPLPAPSLALAGDESQTQPPDSGSSGGMGNMDMKGMQMNHRDSSTQGMPTGQGNGGHP